jgi:hypothetical protein
MSNKEKGSNKMNKKLTPVCNLVDGSKEWYLKGKRHREDGPALEHWNGSKLWYLNGKLHRLNGPAIEWSNESKEWWVKGKRHRLDGPAIEREDGTKEWYVNGERHRIDGPAIEYAHGCNLWYFNGLLHRLDGPAVIYDSDKKWYIKDKEYSYEEFLKLTFFPKEQYSINEAGITYIRLENNLGLRVCLYTELWYNGIYKIVNDETLDQLIKKIDKDNPIINTLHDYVLENLTSLNV